MKFKVGRLSLLRELNFIQPVTEKKSTIPILTSLHFSASHKQTGGVTIHGTDLDSHLITFVDAEIIEPGSCCIPAKKLTEIVKALPEAEITFTIEGESVRITCERSKFKLTGHQPDNFPKPKMQPDKLLPFPADTLKTLISRVKFAVSDAESRYSTNGVKFEYKDGQARTVATDGHRLAFCARPAYFEGEAIDTLIPIKTADLVIKLLETNEPVQFGIESGTLFFNFGKRTLISRTIVGQFPNYELIFVKPQGSVVADCLRLRSTLSRVALVTDDRSKAAKLVIGKDQLVATAATAEVGEGQAEMDVDSSFDTEITLGFNVQYISDYFGVMPEGSVKIEIKDEMSQITMKPVEDGDFDFRYVVMPMRI